MSNLELIIYPKPDSKKLIHFSPFCAKSEIFLKLAKLDFKLSQFSGSPSKFAKNKLPVLKDGGSLICDSSFIQKYLENKYNVDLDNHLNAEEKAIGYAFSKMLEEFAYWSILHERWFIEENWVRLKEQYFSNIPKLIRGLITNSIKKKTYKSAIGHGMSRHTNEEIHAHGKEALGALSNFLGQKSFLLGEKTSSYDSTAYAFVSCVLHSDLSPKLKKTIGEHKNLVDYDQRMFEMLF